MFSLNNFYISRVFSEFFLKLKIMNDLCENKRQFVILFFFSLFIIILEGYSLSIVLDVASSTTNKNFVSKNYFLTFFEISNIFIPVLLLFIFIFFKNILSIIFIIYKNHFLVKSQMTITNKVLAGFLNKDYNFFVNKNSSELTSVMMQDIGLFMRTYTAVLHLLLESCLLVFILSYLFFLNIEIGLIFFFAISFYFLTYMFIVKRKLIFLGSQRNILFQKILKNLSETFANFRELIIYDCKNIFINSLNYQFKKFFRNLFQANILQQTSKVLIEQVFIAVIMSIIVFLIYSNETTELNSFLPLLAVYLFAFLKIIPSFNKIIMESQSYISNKLFVQKVYESIGDLNKNKLNNFLEFKNTIEIKKLNFKFNDLANNTLKNINLVINKNEKIGIVGRSGMGKTTFLNLLMGFFHPSSGKILVDGLSINMNLEGWREKIAYVSQSVYLLDESIAKNITFQNNKELIDQDLLEKSIIFSGLGRYIKNLPLDMDTVVGERGSKISGGEILRIALARAYYSNREIFILDEFTSSLDADTESEILNNLEFLDKTIIMVSHKQSTLKKCDKVYQLGPNGLLLNE